MDREIRAAISGRHLLRFRYGDCLRIAEPHDYGVQRGVVKLFAYQVGGESKSGKLPEWRMFIVSKMRPLGPDDPSPATQSFPGSRPVAGGHNEWDELFASVSRKPFNRRR